MQGTMSNWLYTYGNDFFSFVISVLLLLVYQLRLNHKAEKNRAYTVRSVNAMARTAWVVTIMREGKDILAVQTLRNSTMAATFLASTSVLLIIGVLTLSGQADRLEGTWHVLNTVGSRHAELWQIKLLFLLLILFVAFFSFSMSIRIFNHVGYMINVPLALNHRVLSPDHVAAHINRAGDFYSIGMRAYHFSVPVVFWLFSPYLMLVATMLLIIVMYHTDRAPKTLLKDYA